VDVVALSVFEQALQVLLVRRPNAPGEPFPGRQALPGGFIDVAIDVDLVSCARRKLRDKTARGSLYLEQLGSWGGAARDPRGWSATHAYLALLPEEGALSAHGAAPGETPWRRVDEVLRKGGLAFDHLDILAAGVERLRSKAEYTSLPAYLLAEPFTLPQLQRTYEVVLGRPVDKSGFRTRMLSAHFLVEAGQVEGDSNRPPMGYRLREPGTPAIFPRTFSPRG
jgi:8-oxo-dGTP diphosphatase